MQQKQLPPSDEDQYFSVRKKHFFITFLLVILIIVFSIRYLFSHGLYVGFTPPPEPSPPLSQELISRFHQLEEQFPDWSYELEVSSAGLEHPLKMLRQYKKNIGRNLEVHLHDGKLMEGKLLNAD